VYRKHLHPSPQDKRWRTNILACDTGRDTARGKGGVASTVGAPFVFPEGLWGLGIGDHVSRQVVDQIAPSGIVKDVGDAGVGTRWITAFRGSPIAAIGCRLCEWKTLTTTTDIHWSVTAYIL
jgi:hypothetical protein